MVLSNNYIAIIVVLILLVSSPHTSLCFSIPASKGGKDGTKVRSHKDQDTIHVNSNYAVSLAISIALTTASAITMLPAAVSAKMGDAASIESGKVLFAQNCASCHLNGENIMNPKKDLKKETLLKFIGTSTTDVLDGEQIVSWIEKSGQHKRLFFPNVPGGKLTHENYEDAISFVVDQAGNSKW